MTSRIRVLPYKMGSKSGKALATYVGAKRLYSDDRCRFVGRSTDTIINWGSQRTIRGTARVLNTPDAVYKASNKLVSLQSLDRAGVSIPKYFTDLVGVPRDVNYYARTKLSGHSGEGIVVIKPDDAIVDAPLYTQHVKKSAEYRAIVVGDRVVDFKRKLRKREFEGERDGYVWNCANGYVFARSGIDKPTGIDALSIASIKALGLDFGAVDIIQERHTGILYVLEVNTAFGIEGSTLELVGNAIKEML